MNVIEYIEQQHQLVLSDEVQDYISSLKEVDDYILPYIYKNLVILKGCGKCKVFTSIDYSNTWDWVELNSAFAVIYTYHFFNRYRKRMPLTRTQNLNIRCNKQDRLLDMIQTLWGISPHLVICGSNIEGILSKKRQHFYWCEDGLIPITALSPTIIRCDTFLSVDILSEKQGKFWYNIYKDLYKQNK